MYKAKAFSTVWIIKCQKRRFGTKSCEDCKDKFICFTVNDALTTHKPNYALCAVPNTQEGIDFINQLRKYLNNDVWRVKIRGRHPHRKSELRIFRGDVKLIEADWLAVYLEVKN